jgi:hypothetical protein
MFKFFSFFKKKKATQKEPLIKIIGDEIDPVTNAIKLDLEWNDEFIKYLRDHGFTGTSDELVMKKYLEGLYRDMSDRLDNKFKSEYE